MTKPTHTGEPPPREITEALSAPVREPTEAFSAPVREPTESAGPSREPTEALAPLAHAPDGSVGTEPLSAGPNVGSTDILDGVQPIDPRVWSVAITTAADLPVVPRKNYRVIGEYARGGLGRIVQARDQRTGRVVAIKEMLVASDVAARRFAREAMITANLQHPSIVPVYELGRWETGQPFYAMKLVAGRPFSRELAALKTLDERLARLPVIVAVAEALAYAHGRHVIHRDLKPANVLIGDFGETVVIDWGLAKTVGEVDPPSEDEPARVRAAIDDAPTEIGAILGTPTYMAPEQARGETVDERVDVYAIGAMLYHLIAGHAPYSDKKLGSSRAIVETAGKEKPTPLTERERGTPPDLLTIVDKAMARELSERYASASELAADLRRFTTGQLVGAHHYDRRTLFARWLARNRTTVIVGAVAGSLLVATGVVGIRGIVSERDRYEAERDRYEAQRDIAVAETERGEQRLASVLYEKGLVAEEAAEWPRAAIYYAASRRHHDTPAAAWAAGLAEARAVLPSVRYGEHAGSWVHGVAISPDGERVATVDDAGELRLWSPRDGSTIAHVKIAKTALYAVAFSPDGHELAVAGDDGTIERRGLDLSPLATLRGHKGRVWSLAYAPDGKHLASGGEDTHAILWSLDGDPAPRLLVGHSQRVYTVAFSNDGGKLASGGDDRQLWLWEVATARGTLRGEHSAGIRVVAFANDAVVSTGWDHEIRIWKPGAQPELWADSHIVHGAAIAGGGAVLVTGGEFEAIHAWDLSTHRLITSLAAPGGQTSAVAVSRDGRWLVTAGKTSPIAWDATGLARVAGVGHHSEVGGLAYSADGKRLISGSIDHTLRIWDVAAARELRRISTGAIGCGDGVQLVGDDVVSSCDDRTIRRWRPDGGLDVIRSDVWLRFTALSADRRLLAAGHLRGRLALIDVADWKPITEATLHGHQIYGVQFGPDRLITSGLDDHVHTWKLPTLAPDLDLKVGADDGELAAALSPDGNQIATATQVGDVHVWDTAAGSWRTKISLPNAGTMWKLIYTPAGTTAFTASDDGIVRVWDTKTWKDPRSLDAREGPALSLAISPDGTRLAAGYQSGAIVIWDPRSGAPVTRLGGRTRDRGSCAELERHAWVDDNHRGIVATACVTSAGDYLARLIARSHQRLDDEVDATWEWLPRQTR